MSIILTCNVTGKTVKWSNQSIIDAKIKEYGSLEAFQKAYVSRGANKKSKTSIKSALLRDGEVSLMKSIFEEGIKLAPANTTLSTKHMTNEEYVKHYEDKIAALVAVNAPQSEINWLMQRLDRWRSSSSSNKVAV
jgi:gamma-glutamyl phosphate reductase